MKRLLLAITALLCTHPVWASENPPIPTRKNDALNQYQERLTQEEQAKGTLKKKIKTIQSDLRSTRQKLIDSARDIQNNQESLKSLEIRIQRLEHRKNALNQNVQVDRKSIARLINALQRLRRTPPEAMFAQDKSPYKTAQSALIMSDIIPTINRHAAKLNKTLQTLDQVSAELKQQRTTLMETSDNLVKQQQRLSGLLDKRQTLHAKIDQDIKIREITIQKISLQAKNLEDLVARIKAEEQAEEKRRKAARLTSAKPKPPVAMNFGEARLPISGIIRTAYNKTDSVGAKSKGLTIEGRADSIVIAPMNGKIQFSGVFKRYGNLVIIEHANGYHSLIAGLSIINVNVGADVKSGEPIGSLPDSSLNPRPTLYYELRRNGKPVNPAQKFAQLG